MNASQSGAVGPRDTTPDGEPTTSERALAARTTLRLGGPAKALNTATAAEDLVDLVRGADEAGRRLLVLGGGSNLVIADDGFDGQVVQIATGGRRYERSGPGRVQLTVESGEDWDDVVADTISEGLGGLECLSGIPGRTGATPVQNVGAYGVEISEMLVSVDLLERATGRVRTVPARDLGLDYRTSKLKHTDAAVVLRVRLTLSDDGLSAPIRYGELARVLGVNTGERVESARVREAVLTLRRGKGMVLDPADHDTWSAGSFFTNPILPREATDRVLEGIAAQVGSDDHIPRYGASDGRTKLSAAWLIERAGFTKGYPGPGGRVSLSTKHTLALTNRGGATTSDLIELASDVRDGVRAGFGVSLVPEPILVGCSL